MEDQDQIDYNNIIDILINTFGEVLSRDVIYNIVENFGGDLEESANAVMNIIMDENSAEVTHIPPDFSVDQFEQVVEEGNKPNTTSDIHSTRDSKIAMTYQAALSNVNASRTTNPPLYQATKTTSAPDIQNLGTDQIQLILSHHENGACILIIMRGLPGSGKTYLAQKIIDAIYCTKNQHYQTHILSTDDYFMRNGEYIYDKSRLSQAHYWNQNRARKAMKEGLSPVIIDNTNIELWAMEYYVVEGVKNGYIIEVVEPNTPWAKKVNQLCRRNSHNVPAIAIQRKLDNFQTGINGDYLLKKFELQYSSSSRPPVLRTIPPFLFKLTKVSLNSGSHLENVSVSTQISSVKDTKEYHHENSKISTTDTTIATPPIENASEYSQISSPVLENNQIAEIQKFLEDMDNVEKEWENGEDWEENRQKKPQGIVDSGFVESKPQRKNKLMGSGTTKKFVTSDEVNKDWSKCFELLPSWGDTSCSNTQMEDLPVIEKKTSSTRIEYGDTIISSEENRLKVITAVPRNINEYHIAAQNKKMPEKWMLDKSTSTHDNNIFTDAFNCPHKEQHFNVFRKLFKNIARSDLRDIFDSCIGDVNWAVNIVLKGGVRSKSDIFDSNDHSDTEAEEQDVNLDLCQCLAAYDIIPATNDSLPPPVIERNQKSNEYLPSPSRTKGKKENTVSESSIQLKRQIEQNVVISDNHYSEHCLKIRKFRRGELLTDEEYTNDEQTHTGTPEPHNTESYEACAPPNEQYTPNHSSTPSTSKMENVYSETYDEDSPIVFEDNEKTINIHLGYEFISKLDEFFGRRDMQYPSNVKPKINIPLYLLNEINALWMESFMDQLEDDVKQSEMMVKQDEEFAHQLAMKEAELSQAGKEPEVPDFKEIMDMDFALSVYHKDVAEWRNHMPDDLAAILTREKLYNLFPEVPKEVLSELLMAHDNNFQQTVEALLISTGKTEILESKNGIGKFVMQKEMERQEKLLEEERKAISELEWPLLPKSEKVDMSIVNHYRGEADKHLRSRNLHYQKAHDYIRRGMTPAATYICGVAAYHKRMFELSNSKAAATLIQATRSSDNSIIDLHYLRVGEAKESVDLFMDSHIQKLREMQERNGVKFHNLYFITGRGLHSNGGPRIKPAVMKRLNERGIVFSEKNPGLLTAKVRAEDKLSHEIA